MTKLPQRIDFSPDTLYPDKGCVAWPSCLDCPFDPCINTADKDPTAMERERAILRREIVRHRDDDMTLTEIAIRLDIGIQVVDRALAKYRQDAERAR